MGEGKMRRPLLPVLLPLAITILLSTTPASSIPSYRWLQNPLRSPFLWGAADLPSWIKNTINTHAPIDSTPTRFQRGVDPADEGLEVDMRMIFDELKRDMKAAMEEKEEDTRTVWPEPAEEKKEEDGF